MVALCGFVFGVACRLPPALTILLLNGCFCFPIGAYLVRRKLCSCLNSLKSLQSTSTQNYGQSNGNYHQFRDSESVELNNVTNTSQQSTTGSVGCNVITFILEALGFLMQFGVLVTIPILLTLEESRSRVYYIAVIILLPISLFLLSFVWSGWAVIQKKTTRHGKVIHGSDRLKAGRKTYVI